MSERFMLDEAGEVIDLQTHQFIEYGKEIVDLLNELNDENEQLRDVNAQCCNDYSAMLRDVLHYKKENEQLKESVYSWSKSYNRVYEENEELKQRNNRQAKQLDNLYRLIEKKDWKTFDDFKKAEEQLLREWRTYE